MAPLVSKSELAAEYGVHVDTLMRWIRKNQKLLARLRKSGYKPTQRLLTARQAGLIRQWF